MDPNELSPEQRAQLEEKLKNMSPEEIADLQRQQCIFCQIIDGKIPSKKVYEDEHCISFLDIRPATKGHCLIVPKKHYSIIPQVPKDELGHLFIIAKFLSKIILKSLRVKGTTIFAANGAAAGQRAPHIMIHVIPRNPGDELITAENVPIDTELQQKVKNALIPQFRTLMGLPPLDTQATLPEPKTSEPVVEEVKENIESEETKEEVETEEPSEDTSEEEFDGSLEEQLGGSSEEETEEDDSDETEDASEEEDDSEDDESDEEEPEEVDEVTEEDDDQEEKEDEVDVSLDDIASLFK